MVPELPYSPSLALLTDLYQLTMAQAYVQHGTADEEAVFHLHFRKPPFGGGYTVAAGLGTAAAWLESLRFDAADRAYLAGLRGNDGKPLFAADFLDWLADFRFACDVHAVPEGTVVYPHEPVMRVQGPLAHCQLVETALLTILNFQTLIATKAARCVHVAGGMDVLEFGLRRAQGIDGGLSASRAAYVGGCSATSNVLAGRLFGIPVRGTHAHSWVMSFDDEREAFAAYAAAFPNNATFLVDTYDTRQGVAHAIEAGEALREKGHRMAGIRLDSGDLAVLSIDARRMLDAAGFTDARVVASGDLDERLIESLRHQGARIDVWAVGTKLATGGDQCALGGVYKLSGVRKAGADWAWRVKLSENPVKISTPGVIQVRRFEQDGVEVGDALYNEAAPLPDGDWQVVDVDDPTHTRTVPASCTAKDLLVPVFRRGDRVLAPEPLDAARTRVQAGLARLRPAQLRLDNPQRYPVGLESGLHQLKLDLVTRARAGR
jgi:nicotinate phosphoribosyltransferase